jgi:hypothetical protein
MKTLAYNADQNLIVYPCGDGFSCYRLSMEKVNEIAPELLLGETVYPLRYVEVTDEQSKALHEAHLKERFVVVKGFQIPRGTPRKIANTVIEAFQNRQPIMVEYEEGYEMVSDDGFHDDSGRVHTVWLGCSTGKLKTLLHLENPRSGGGMCFMFSGIKNVRILPVTY